MNPINQRIHELMGKRVCSEAFFRTGDADISKDVQGEMMNWKMCQNDSFFLQSQRLFGF